MSKINKDIVSFLLKAAIYTGGNQQIQEARSSNNQENLQTSRKSDIPDPNSQQSDTKPKNQPVRTEQKVERNAPCPCGSGKKYKKCHGR